MTEGERGDIANGIWLCRGCHKILDADAAAFSVEALVKMKADAEADAAALLGVTPLTTNVADMLGAISRNVEQVRDLLAPMTDEDAKYVASRIETFDASKRVLHLGGYLFGVSPELLGRLTDKEFNELFKSVAEVPFAIVKVLALATSRLVFETSGEFRATVRPNHPELPHLFGMTLNIEMVARINFVIQPRLTKDLQPKLLEYSNMPFRGQLENNLVQIWDMMQKCISAYDASRHRAGSDEELRRRIAVIALDGATSREEFEKRLRAATVTYFDEMATRREKFLALLPSELIAVSDARGLWERPDLLKRMATTLENVGTIRDAVRGKPPTKS